MTSVENGAANGQPPQCGGGDSASAAMIATLEARCAALEREKMDALSSVGTFVVEKEKLKETNAQIEAAFEELHSRYQALRAEQEAWVAREKGLTTAAAEHAEQLSSRDEEIMRLESAVAEAAKQREADAAAVADMRKALDSDVSAVLAQQKATWQAQVQEVAAAFQEEKEELTVFNDVLKAKTHARALEAAARADQVAALERENAQLRIAVERLATRVETQEEEKQEQGSGAATAAAPGTGLRASFKPLDVRVE